MSLWARAASLKRTSGRCSVELGLHSPLRRRLAVHRLENDLDARVALHASGRGCKYTRSHLPVVLVYSEEYVSEHDARSREWHIKRLSRKEKLSLIERKETPPDVQKI